MSTQVLVINSGSSSIKYQLVDLDAGEPLGSGLVERIGLDTGRVIHKGSDGETIVEQPIPDHEEGMRLVLALFAEHGPVIVEESLAAVGHRVVQGGSYFDRATVIDDEVIGRINELATLAPLHNPPNLSGIEAARHAFPATAHVAVFDTAFHQTMPPSSYTYAIDREVAAQYSIRRYGAHGTSHMFVARATAEALGRPVHEVSSIILHLGNGASVTAVKNGESIATSMGLTPLEGLVMGTRSGDIDPAALIHLMRVADYTAEDLDQLLNRRSGMLGLSGYTDMRDVHAAIEAGNEDARTALGVYCHRIRGYVGQYLAHLGGHVDAITFTAGIGENDDIVRWESLAGLEGLGIVVDPERNAGRVKEPRLISADDSKIAVWVIPTEEELEIARQSLAAVQAG